MAQCNWDVTDGLPIVYGEEQKGKKEEGKQQDEQLKSHSDVGEKPIRVSYLTEQTSHHPPVSAFWIDCPAKGITAYGFDQLSAKFTPTPPSIRVMAGNHNKGIYISVPSRNNEEYQMTHPTAQLGGLFRGTLTISVADTCFVTCPQNRLKAVLHYMEEGWLGKTQNKVEGAIYKYDLEKDNITRLKDVPDKDIVARFEGCWHEKISWRLPDQKVSSIFFQPDPRLLHHSVFVQPGPTAPILFLPLASILTASLSFRTHNSSSTSPR